MKTPREFSAFLARLQQTDLEFSLTLELDDCLVRVESNSDILINGLRHYFAPFISRKHNGYHIRVKAWEGNVPQPELSLKDKPPEPGKTRIKEQFARFNSGIIVRKQLSGMMFFFNATDHLAMGPCEENENQVVNFINNRFIQWKLDQGCLLCHAAAVASDEKGIILAGFSGMGKSTLALHLMNRTRTFISNDRLMVSKNNSELIMYGVPKLPRVNPGTILNNPSLKGMLTPEEIRHFSGLSPEELWNLEHKYDVFLDQCYGPDRFRLHSRAMGLIILNWTRSTEPVRMSRVSLDQRLDLLGTVMKSPGIFYLDSHNRKEELCSPDNYIALFADCPVYEISGGVDFKGASELCGKLLN